MGERVQSFLRGMGQVVLGPFRPEELAAVLAECDVLMVRLGRYIGSDVLELAPKLRWIVSATTGIDHLDMLAIKRRGVCAVTLRDCMSSVQSVSSTAELAWGLLMAVERRIPQANSHVSAGGWSRDLFWSRQLKGLTLGILGFGRVGRMVADYGRVFGMRVLVCDPNVPDSALPGWASRVRFDGLWRESDCVSVHVTGAPQNDGLVSRAALSLAKPGMTLINTSRGYVLDESAVAEALASGGLAGVGVDVLTSEDPDSGGLPANPLHRAMLDGKNVIMTPHLGGATLDALETAELAVLGELRRRLS